MGELDVWGTLGGRDFWGQSLASEGCYSGTRWERWDTLRIRPVGPTFSHGSGRCDILLTITGPKISFWQLLIGQKNMQSPT